MDVQSVAIAAAAMAHRLTRKLPKSSSLRDQLTRSAESAALNTVEGLAYRGAQEKKFLTMAHASVQEAKAATQILGMSGAVDLHAARQLWLTLHRTGGMLWGLIRKS